MPSFYLHEKNYLDMFKKMVRVTGVEPVRLLPLPSENSMSTNSITLALKY